MTYIVYILGIVYALVFYVSRPKRTTIPGKTRIFVYALSLSILIIAQSFYEVTKPPKVNYYQTGWMGFFQYLNARFAERGITNRIPTPKAP